MALRESKERRYVSPAELVRLADEAAQGSMEAALVLADALEDHGCDPMTFDLLRMEEIFLRGSMAELLRVRLGHIIQVQERVVAGGAAGDAEDWMIALLGWKDAVMGRGPLRVLKRLFFQTRDDTLLAAREDLAKAAAGGSKSCALLLAENLEKTGTRGRALEALRDPERFQVMAGFMIQRTAEATAWAPPPYARTYTRRGAAQTLGVSLRTVHRLERRTGIRPQGGVFSQDSVDRLRLAWEEMRGTRKR